MKATHRLIKWFRWNGAHTFEKSLTYLCRFKKDGDLMVWRGTHRVCMGAYPPTLFYFKNQNDWEKKRGGQWNSSGTKKPFQFYYTLEQL